MTGVFIDEWKAGRKYERRRKKQEQSKTKELPWTHSIFFSSTATSRLVLITSDKARETEEDWRVRKQSGRISGKAREKPRSVGRNEMERCLEEERFELTDYQREQRRWKTKNTLILCHQKAVARPHYCQRRHRHLIIIKLKFTQTPCFSLDDADDDGWTTDKNAAAVDKWLSSLMAIYKNKKEGEGIRTSRSDSDVRKERKRKRRRRRRRRKTKSYLLTLGSREKDVSSLPDYFSPCSFFYLLFPSCTHKYSHYQRTSSRPSLESHLFVSWFFFFSTRLFRSIPLHLFVTDRREIRLRTASNR